MFIPISYTVKYKDYPDAPKASRKSKILGYVTAWPFVLITGLQVWNTFRRILIVNFNGEKYASSFIAALMAVIVYGLFVRFLAFVSDITDKQAVIEAYTNKFSRYDPNIESVKSDVKSKSLLAAIILAVSGLIFGALEFWTLPRTPGSINDFAENELRPGNTYYAPGLYVIGGYAQSESGRKYYVAVFNDKDDKPCLISFAPSKKSKAQRIIDERESSDPCKLPCYIKIDHIDSDLYKFYRKALELLPDTRDTGMDAEYICSEGENVALNSIGEKELFCFMVAGVLVLLGMCTLKGAIFSS